MPAKPEAAPVVEQAAPAPMTTAPPTHAPGAGLGFALPMLQTQAPAMGTQVLNLEPPASYANYMQPMDLSVGLSLPKPTFAPAYQFQTGAQFGLQDTYVNEYQFFAPENVASVPAVAGELFLCVRLKKVFLCEYEC